MAFISTTAWKDATDQTYTMYKHQYAHHGYVPEYARVFCHRPEIMELWAALQEGIKRNLEPRIFQLVTIAASMALSNSGCSLAYGTRLLKYYTAPDLHRIVTGVGVESGVLSPADDAIMRFAALVASRASAVTQADIDELRHHGINDAMVFDIAATASGRAFFSKLIDSLTDLSDHEYPKLTTELRNALQAGRKIKTAESTDG